MIKDLNIVSKYGDYGINTDDLIDWLGDNKIKITNLLNKVDTSDKTKFINNIRKNGLYTENDFKNFSSIVDNEKELVQIIMKNFEIEQQMMIRPSLEKSVKEVLKKYGYVNIEKEIEEFLLFIYDFELDIEVFYETNYLPF